MYQRIRLEIPAYCNHPAYFDEYLMDVGLFCADSCMVDMSYTIPEDCERAKVRVDLSESQIKKLERLEHSFGIKKVVILRCIFNDMHWKPSKYISIPPELQQPLDYGLIDKESELPDYHHLGREKRNAKKNK